MRRSGKLVACLVPVLLSAQQPVQTAPVLVTQAPASYTQEARAAGVQGSVLLYVHVMPDGRPGNVTVLQSLGFGLDEKAVEAVRSWEYTPGKVNGEPAAVAVSAEVPFRISAERGWSVRRTNSRVNYSGRNPWPQVPPVLAKYTAPDAGSCTDEAAHATFVISNEGVPELVSATTPMERPLPKAVRDAISEWRFTPATVRGKPASAQQTVRLDCGDATSAEPEPSPPYRVGGVVTAPRVLAKIDPEYSEEARQAKAQGTVLLSVVVDRSGRAKNLQIVRGLGMGLDERAMAAVLQWVFAPGTRNGTPVDVRAQIEVNFRLL